MDFLFFLEIEYSKKISPSNSIVVTKNQQTLCFFLKKTTKECRNFLLKTFKTQYQEYNVKSYIISDLKRIKHGFVLKEAILEENLLRLVVNLLKGISQCSFLFTFT
jgi:hypothetical protein